MSNRAWLTWETQCRNNELAQAFDCDIGCFDWSMHSKFLRYYKSTIDTLKFLRKKKYQTLFVQCPSVILCVLISIYTFFSKSNLVIDCHNIVLDQADSNLLMRFIVKRIFKQSAYVIVSNDTLVSRAERYNATPMILPDKLPKVSNSKLPEEFGKLTRPYITFICSFASDEPIDEFLTAASMIGSDFTLFVTGKRSSAKRLGLLKYESEKIIFTDYLSRDNYDGLIRHSNLLVILTTRDDCLVCGAYEALEIGTLGLLSDTKVLRECFSDAFLYSNNSIVGYRNVLDQYLADPNCKNKKNNLLEYKKSFILKWKESFSCVDTYVKKLEHPPH